MARKPKRLVSKDTMFGVVKEALERHGLTCPDNLTHAYHLSMHPEERVRLGYDSMGLVVCIEAIEGSEVEADPFDPEVRDVDLAVNAVAKYIEEIDSVVEALDNLGINVPLPAVDGSPVWFYGEPGDLVE